MNDNLPAGFKESEGNELSLDAQMKACDEAYDLAEAVATGN